MLTFLSVIAFLILSAYHREGEITIAFAKSLLFGFVYDAEVEDGIKYHTFQAAAGFIILNLTYQTIEDAE